MPSRWRVAIADDEPAARRGVRQLLAPYPEFEVVCECRDGRETLRALEADHPDVLFLDIQMPEVNGFDVLRSNRVAARPEIVLLTAYDQFAIKAFEAEALDYLVKPVSDERFKATIARLHRRLAPVSSGEASLFVPTSRGGITLSLQEIDWIESADNYARIWAGSRSHLVRESLDDLEARIGTRGFVRAHRQALVRIGAVRIVQGNHSGELVAILASGAKVRVSRRRRAAFREAVRRW